jgi:hypothetical protein
MCGSANHVERFFAAPDHVPHFSNGRLINFRRSTRKAVHAANLLHGSGRDGEWLSRNAEEDDLFRARGGVGFDRWRSHSH